MAETLWLPQFCVSRHATPTVSLSVVHDSHKCLTPGWLPLCPWCSLGLLSTTSTSLKVTFDSRINILLNCSYVVYGILRANFLESQGSFTYSLHDLSFPIPLLSSVSGHALRETLSQVSE